MSLLRGLGKVPVHVRKDVPGFVGNRLQHALWREASRWWKRAFATPNGRPRGQEQFRLGLAVLGPLENADLVGTDLVQDIHNHVLGDLKDSPWPSPLLDALVRHGRLGFKSNQGFMSWTEDKKSCSGPPYSTI